MSISTIVISAHSAGGFDSVSSFILYACTVLAVKALETAKAQTMMIGFLSVKDN